MAGFAKVQKKKRVAGETYGACVMSLRLGMSMPSILRWRDVVNAQPRFREVVK